MFLPSQGPVRRVFVALCGGIFALSLFAQEDEPLTAEALFQLGRYEEAYPLLVNFEAEWSAKVRGEDSLETRMLWLGSLLGLGMVEDRLNKYDDALHHLSLARDLAVEGNFDPQTKGDVFDALGKAQHKARRFEDAEQSLAEAIKHRQGQEPWYSASRNQLASVYLTTGRYEEAGRIFLETLARAGSDQNVLALRHGYLGDYFYTMRSYARAAEHFERALEMANQAWGEVNPNTISYVGQLGMAYLRLRSYERARKFLTRAATLTRNRPPSHLNSLTLASYLSNLGSLELEDKHFKRARDLFLQAFDLVIMRVDNASPVLAPYFINIGFANQQLGEFEKAQDAYREAAERFQKAVGTRHQRYLEAKLNLVENLFLSSGPNDATAAEIKQTIEEALPLFHDIIAFGTERQRLNWLHENHLLTLPCSLGTDPGFIANTILHTKSRILDSLLLDQQDSHELREEFRLKQRRRDDLLFRFEDGEELRQLNDEITALESGLRTRAQEIRKDITSIANWTEIQDSLPPHSAFVDYVRYPDLNKGAESPLSYGALVILPAGAPHWIPLGSEEDLNIWLGIMKERLDYRSYVLNSQGSTTPPALRMSSALRRIHDLFWAPVAAVLPSGTESVGISPDASLNFLSFAVLLDKDHKFLASQYRQIAYFSSGRDLLIKQERPSLHEGPWAMVAVPSFEESSPPGEGTAPDALSQVILETINTFPDVPGAEEELHLLARIIPSGARTTELLNAREQEVRGLTESPVVLHLSTHAFFLPTVEDDNITGVPDFDQQPDRFYRSGLVFTEAKRAHAARARGESISFENDGVLFSHEVESLPLHNTRLVTLSSCESGLGESVSGEGVLSLRRGFTLAGASNILISLWPVSDNSTPKFMERMYRLSLATEQIGQSLWETQRRILAEVDPTDDAALEEAVLRYGCFVLCQRGPLEAAVEMPELKDPFKFPWPIALALAGVAVFLITRSKSKRSPQG